MKELQIKLKSNTGEKITKTIKYSGDKSWTIQKPEQVILIVEGQSDKIIYEQYLKKMRKAQYFNILVANGITKIEHILEDELAKSSANRIVVIWDEDRRNKKSDFLKNKIRYHTINENKINYERVYFSELALGSLEDYYPQEIRDLQLSKVEKANKLIRREKFNQVIRSLNHEDICYLGELTSVFEHLNKKQVSIQIGSVQIPIASNISEIKVDNLAVKIDCNTVLKIGA